MEYNDLEKLVGGTEEMPELITEDAYVWNEETQRDEV